MQFTTLTFHNDEHLNQLQHMLLVHYPKARPVRHEYSIKLNKSNLYSFL